MSRIATGSFRSGWKWVVMRERKNESGVREVRRTKNKREREKWPALPVACGLNQQQCFLAGCSVCYVWLPGRHTLQGVMGNLPDGDGDRSTVTASVEVVPVLRDPQKAPEVSP